MIKKYLVLLISLSVFSCKEVKEETANLNVLEIPELSLKEAIRLSELPLHCIDSEYPNRLGQTLGSTEDLQSPKELHPSFYGCFDWHSSVHGHWSIIRLLKKYPEIKDSDLLWSKLENSITEENIKQEILYFSGEFNKSFERTYGWAWLLKMSEELEDWNHPKARILKKNLSPLTNLIVDKYKKYLPKLYYPIRVGEHQNTAFGLSFAYDYAKKVGEVEFQKIIEETAKKFYLKDMNCPMSWEPGGYDFLSPCLEEASLLKKILPKNDYVIWLKGFLPNLFEVDYQLKVGVVSDRKDAKMVHIDGVNFSRAWCLNEISKGIPELAHLKNIAIKHVDYSLPNIVDGNYQGGHWLGSFAIYALGSFK